MSKDIFNKRVLDLPESKVSKIFSIANSLEDVVSLGVGEPDFDTPWNVRAEAIYQIERGNTFYTDNIGFLELRKEIANYLQRRFNLKYNPQEEILCTVGGSEAVDIIMRTFLNEGDEVILPTPAYMAYEPCILLAGGVVKAIELKEENHFRLSKEELAKAITPRSKILMLNYPSNPTGGVMCKEDYLELLPLIKEHNLLVVSDEIYGELSYSCKHFSIAEIEEIHDQVLYFSGVSKAYSMTGWRLGYICGAKEYIKQLAKVHQYATMCPPTISQYAAIVALRECDKDIEEMKKSFQQRRNFIVSGLNEIGLKCHYPEGAFYVFPSIKETGLSSDEFCEELLKAERVAVVPGDSFGAAGEGYIRCSYAYSMEEIKEALTRIERFLGNIS